MAKAVIVLHLRRRINPLILPLIFLFPSGLGRKIFQFSYFFMSIRRTHW